jgi:hypothetical protein
MSGRAHVPRHQFADRGTRYRCSAGEGGLRARHVGSGNHGSQVKSALVKTGAEEANA